MRNYIKKIEQNKEYLLWLGFVLLITGGFISLFWDKSICMQEGWYNIYVKNILQGQIPYKDFSLIVTPFSLLIDTLIYKIFGGAFIVSHIAGIIERLLLFGFTYHLFTKFFSKPHSAFAALTSGIFLTSAIFDNSLFTYNEFAILIGVISTIFIVNFVDSTEKTNEIDYKSLVLLALNQGIALLNKQTFGIITTFASLIIIAIIITRKFGAKKLIKPMLIFFAILTGYLVILLGYFIYNGALLAFFEDTFLTGASAKGSLFSILFYYFKFLGSTDYMWPIFISIFVAIFLFYLSKGKKLVDENFNTSKFVTISTLIGISTLFASYNFVKYFSDNLLGLSYVYQINKSFMQIGAVAIFFITTIAFLYFIKITLEEKYEALNARNFAIYGMFFALAYALSLSNVLPNFFFFIIGLFTALILSLKTRFNIFKNVLIYICVFTVLFLGSSVKLISPCIWHSWISGNITKEITTTQIKALKGLKLPVEEVAAFEEIKGITDKYTKKDDKIFIYNNIQAFYEILERMPYTDNVSHFWDVCPDEYAQKDAKTILNSPPPLIVYLQAPEDLVYLYEDLFRNNSFAGQRDLDKAILSMIENNKYVQIKKYTSYKPDYEKYIKDKNELKQYKDAKANLAKYLNTYKTSKIEKNNDMNLFYKKSDLDLLIFETEYKIKKKYKLYNKRTFLPDNYELKILVRKDIYDKHN